MSSAATGGVLLLVEDDEQLVEATARALRSQGWVVDCTARGETHRGIAIEERVVARDRRRRSTAAGRHD